MKLKILKISKIVLFILVLPIAFFASLVEQGDVHFNGDVFVAILFIAIILLYSFIDKKIKELEGEK